MNPERDNFLEKLRSLSASKKRKIMIFSTVIAMTLVIYLWMAYFNTIVVPSPSFEAATLSSSTASVSGAPGDGVGVLGLFSTALNSFWGVAGNFGQSIGGMLKGSKQYSINPNQ